MILDDSSWLFDVRNPSVVHACRHLESSVGRLDGRDSMRLDALIRRGSDSIHPLPTRPRCLSSDSEIFKCRVICRQTCAMSTSRSPKSKNPIPSALEFDLETRCSVCSLLPRLINLDIYIYIYHSLICVDY